MSGEGTVMGEMYSNGPWHRYQGYQRKKSLDDFCKLKSFSGGLLCGF